MASTAERVQKHRANLRSAGLRPLQIWVPDTRRKGFAEKCRSQSLLIANDPHETEVLDWIENVSDIDGWT
jgi:hypothetical protein